MKVLVDAQLPLALARAISQARHPAEHVMDLGLHTADDTAIWHHAHANGAVLITKDEDFVARHHADQGAVTVIWIRSGNTSRRALLAWFMPLLAQIAKMVESGETLIEVR